VSGRGRWGWGACPGAHGCLVGRNGHRLQSAAPGGQQPPASPQLRPPTLPVGQKEECGRCVVQEGWRVQRAQPQVAVCLQHGVGAVRCGAKAAGGGDAGLLTPSSQTDRIRHLPPRHPRSCATHCCSRCSRGSAGWDWRMEPSPACSCTARTSRRVDAITAQLGHVRGVSHAPPAAHAAGELQSGWI